MLRLNKVTRNVVQLTKLSKITVNSNVRQISSITLKFTNAARCENWNRRISITSPQSIGQLRWYSNKKNEDEDIDVVAEAEIQDNPADFIHTHLPATVAVPEVFPYVPCIAVSRSPVFPRFMKIIELSEPVLMNLIR
jgi:Lon-like ATP-dependent protease